MVSEFTMYRCDYCSAVFPEREEAEAHASRLEPNNRPFKYEIGDIAHYLQFISDQRPVPTVPVRINGRSISAATHHNQYDIDFLMNGENYPKGTIYHRIHEEELRDRVGSYHHNANCSIRLEVTER